MNMLESGVPHQLLQYMSWKIDHSSHDRDAFQIPWSCKFV